MKLLFRNIIIILLLLILILGLLFLGTLYYLLFTEKGSGWVISRISEQFPHYKEIKWDKQEGTLIKGMTLKDFEIIDMDGLPKPNTIKIQKIVFDVDQLSIEGVYFELDNFRAVIDDSEPILLFGQMERGELDFNLSTRRLTLDDLHPFIDDREFKKLSGDIVEADLDITGHWKAINIKGSSRIVLISRDKINFKEAPCLIDVQLKIQEDPIGLYGTITVMEGTLSGDKTALIQLQESQIFFSGDPNQPRLNIRATSTVEDVEIKITLTGDLQKPELKISSDPPLPEMKLLIMLATNKSWHMSEESFKSGALSPDLVKDMIDYFILGGRINQLSEKLGIKNISFTLDEQTKGVSFTKDVNKNLEAKFEMESQTDQEGNVVDTKRKVGGELKVTERLSIEATKELKDSSQAIEDLNDEPPEEAIRFKFETSF